MRARFGVSQANQPPSLPCTAPSHACTKPSASMVLALAGLKGCNYTKHAYMALSISSDARRSAA